MSFNEYTRHVLQSHVRISTIKCISKATRERMQVAHKKTSLDSSKTYLGIRPHASDIKGTPETVHDEADLGFHIGL